MTVAAPPRRPRLPPVDPEALFAEARRHRRQRRLRLAAVALAVVAAGAGLRWALGHGTGDSSAANGGRAAAAGRDKLVMLVVDASGSMRAHDVKPSRRCEWRAHVLCRWFACWLPMVPSCAH